MNGYFNYKDELYHHGVLGMKWGVRRYQKYGKGGYTPKDKKNIEPKRKSELRNRIERNAGKRGTNALKEARSKDINELSTKELKEYNDRLQAEENFKRLTEGGSARAKKWLITAGLGLVTAVTVEVAKSEGKKWAKDHFSELIKIPINFIKNTAGKKATMAIVPH